MNYNSNKKEENFMQKKNKKFARIASACAAALLTMAPVVTPTATAFADDAQNNTPASSDVTKNTSTNTTESDGSTSSSNSNDVPFLNRPGLHWHKPKGHTGHTTGLRSAKHVAHAV